MSKGKRRVDYTQIVCLKRIILADELKNAKVDFLQEEKNSMVMEVMKCLIEKGFLFIETETYDYGIKLTCKIYTTHPEDMKKGELEGGGK